MKALIIAVLLLSGCAAQVEPLEHPDGQPWSCEDYDADQQPRVPGCHHEPRGVGP